VYPEFGWREGVEFAVGFGAGVGFGVALTSGSAVTRGSGKPGSVATAITEVRFHADQLAEPPGLAVAIATGVGTTGCRPPT
jgi:hypothetical protein